MTNMRKLISDLFNFFLRTMARTRLLGPEAIAKLKYFQMLHRWPDLSHPKDLNEKINWLKFNGDTSMWPVLADKYRVREYVKEKGFGDALTRLYGKWDSIEDIDWESLPDRFVLKTNNGCGDVVICRDKSKLDVPSVKEHFSKVLKSKSWLETAEPHYSLIKPAIIAEELLDSSTQPGGSGPGFHSESGEESASLVDYKIWCFDGKPFSVLVCHNRKEESLCLEVHDLDWGFHPEYSVFKGHYVDGKGIIPRPGKFDEMLRMASSLSEGFPEMRVDLYEVDGKVYFGELTFTSLGGYMKYYTDEYLRLMGDQIRLDK